MRGDAGTEPGDGHAGRDRRGARPAAHDRVGVGGDGAGQLRDGRAVADGGGRLLRRAAEAAAQERGDRQERGDPGARGPRRELLDVEAGQAGRAPARLAVRDVAGHLAAVAHAEAALGAGLDDALHAAAALAADELVVLLGEAPAGAEQRRLDRRAAHAQALADLAVAQALELAHDEDLVVGLGEPAERALQVLQRHPLVDRGVGRRAAGHEAAAVQPVLVGVVGDLLRALGAAERVDARVLGDLVDPGLEDDRRVGGAQAAQRGDEDLLRDVLRAAVVVDHAEHVGRDPALVALVELLEGAIVTRAHGGDEVLVFGFSPRAKRRRGCGERSYGPLLLKQRGRSSSRNPRRQH